METPMTALWQIASLVARREPMGVSDTGQHEACAQYQAERCTEQAAALVAKWSVAWVQDLK
jgi:hypothetical protein